MTLEGNLRDLALQEVCQLLAHTRKSGDLFISAPLSGLKASISFDGGAIIGASIQSETPTVASDNDADRLDGVRMVEATALELLTWREGVFNFVPQSAGVLADKTGVRLNTEMILMEGARRIEEWARLSDRIPHARAVPAFVDVEPRHLPLLNLLPQQWEVLTCVDGQRDLPALSRALGRDLMELAEIVHGLIGTGLLKLVDTARVVRTQNTPPSSSSVRSANHSNDLWVPPTGMALGIHESGFEGDDEIFDPVRLGVITPEGLPRLRTPAIAQRSPLAKYRELGDAAARSGNFAEAIAHWRVLLEWSVVGADADHAREAIALVARLQELLQVHQPAA